MQTYIFNANYEYEVIFGKATYLALPAYVVL
jgi:hypothetical protein